MVRESSRTERHALLLELNRALAAEQALDELLPTLVQRIRHVLGAESCAILLLDEAQTELVPRFVADRSSDVEVGLRQLRLPAEAGLEGWVTHHGRPALVTDASADSRFDLELDRRLGTRTRDLVCVPLRGRSSVLGCATLRNREVGAFSQSDVDLLEAAASAIASALENARLHERVRRSEAALREEVAALKLGLRSRDRFGEIVGSSPAMEKVFSLLASAVSSPITVLLEGETGVGKELIARALHYNGPRRDAPFVTVNCGALPETLLESELFGHKKGAFTGAESDKPGLFEVADGGTLFLDEIGETTPSMQVKLLRTLQEGEIRRVGETRSRKADVRVVSATNRDLMEDIRNKRFREDLYYRIRVFPIEVPPLRKRVEDIPALVARFLRSSNEKLERRVGGIAQETLERLVAYAWPGNVRELENEIERAVALTADGAPIEPQALSEQVNAADTVRVQLPAEAGSLKQARLAFEQRYIGEVLRQHRGNATQAARVLGISRQMLQRKIKEFGLREQILD